MNLIFRKVLIYFLSLVVIFSQPVTFIFSDNAGTEAVAIDYSADPDLDDITKAAVLPDPDADPVIDTDATDPLPDDAPLDDAPADETVLDDADAPVDEVAPADEDVPTDDSYLSTDISDAEVSDNPDEIDDLQGVQAKDVVTSIVSMINPAVLSAPGLIDNLTALMGDSRLKKTTTLLGQQASMGLSRFKGPMDVAFKFDLLKGVQIPVGSRDLLLKNLILSKLDSRLSLSTKLTLIKPDDVELSVGIESERFAELKISEIKFGELFTSLNDTPLAKIGLSDVIITIGNFLVPGSKSIIKFEGRIALGNLGDLPVSETSQFRIEGNLDRNADSNFLVEMDKSMPVIPGFLDLNNAKFEFKIKTTRVDQLAGGKEVADKKPKIVKKYTVLLSGDTTLKLPDPVGDVGLLLQSEIDGTGKFASFSGTIKKTIGFQDIVTLKDPTLILTRGLDKKYSIGVSAITTIANEFEAKATLSIAMDKTIKFSAESADPDKELKPLAGTPIPGGDDIALSKLKFEIDSKKQMIIAGNVRIGGLTAVGRFYNQKGVKVLKVGIEKMDDLGKLIPAVKGTFIESFSLSETYVVFSSGKFTDPETMADLQSGVSLLSKVPLVPPFLAPARSLLGVGPDDFVGLAGGFGGGGVSASLSIPKQVKLGEDVSISGVALVLTMKPTSGLEIGVKGRLTAKLPKQDDLTDFVLGCSISTSPAAPGVKLAASMVGEWQHPLGISWLVIKDVAIEVEMAFTPPPPHPSGIGFTGTAKIADKEVMVATKVSQKGEFLLAGELKGKLSLKDIPKAFKQVINDVTDSDLMKDAIALGDKAGGGKLADKVGDKLGVKVPSAAEVIQFAKDLPDTIEKLLPDFGIEDVKLYVAPVDTTIGEFSFMKGLTIKGKVDCSQLMKPLEPVMKNPIKGAAMINFGLSTSGIICEATLPEISLGPEINGVPMFRITGDGMDKIKGNADDGPTFALNLNMSKQELYISGEANLVGQIAKCRVEINRSTFTISANLDTLLGKIDIFGGYVKGEKDDLLFRGEISRPDLNYIKNEQVRTIIQELSPFKKVALIFSGNELLQGKLPKFILNLSVFGEDMDPIELQFDVKNPEKFMEDFAKSILTLVEFALKMGVKLPGKVVTAAGELAKTAGKGMEQAGDFLKEQSDYAKRDIKNAANDVKNSSASAARDVDSALGGGVLGDVGGGIVKGGGQAVGAIVDVSGDIADFGAESLGTVVGGAGVAVGYVGVGLAETGKALTAAGDAILDVGGKAADAISGAFNSVGNFFKGLFGGGPPPPSPEQLRKQQLSREYDWRKSFYTLITDKAKKPEEVLAAMLPLLANKACALPVLNAQTIDVLWDDPNAKEYSQTLQNALAMRLAFQPAIFAQGEKAQAALLAIDGVTLDGSVAGKFANNDLLKKALDKNMFRSNAFILMQPGVVGDAAKEDLIINHPNIFLDVFDVNGNTVAHALSAPLPDDKNNPASVEARKKLVLKIVQSPKFNCSIVTKLGETILIAVARNNDIESVKVVLAKAPYLIDDENNLGNSAHVVTESDDILALLDATVNPDDKGPVAGDPDNKDDGLYDVDDPSFYEDDPTEDERIMVGDIEIVDAWYGTDAMNVRMSMSDNATYRGRSVADIFASQCNNGKLIFTKDPVNLYGDPIRNVKKCVRLQLKKNNIQAIIRVNEGAAYTWVWGDARDYDAAAGVPGLEVGDGNKAYKDSVVNTKIMVGDIEIVDAWYGTDEKNTKVSVVNNPLFKGKDVKRILGDQASGGSLVFAQAPHLLYGDPLPGKLKVVRVQLKKGTTTAIIRMIEGNADTWAWGDKREYSEKDRVSGLETNNDNKAYRATTAAMKAMVQDIEITDAWYGVDDSNSNVSVSGNIVYKGKAIKDILAEKSNSLMMLPEGAIVALQADSNKKYIAIDGDKYLKATVTDDALATNKTAQFKVLRDGDWIGFERTDGTNKNRMQSDNDTGVARFEAGTFGDWERWSLEYSGNSIWLKNKQTGGYLSVRGGDQLDRLATKDGDKNICEKGNQEKFSIKIISGAPANTQLFFQKDTDALYGDTAKGKKKLLRVQVKKGTTTATLRMPGGTEWTWPWGDKREYNEKDNIPGLEAGDINKGYRTAAAQIKTMSGDLELVDAWYGVDDSNSKVSVSGNAAYKGRAVKDILVGQMKDGKLFFQRDTDALYGDTAKGKKKLLRVQVKKGTTTATLRMPGGTEWTWAWGDKREYNEKDNIPGLEAGDVNKAYRAAAAQIKTISGDLELVDAWYGTDESNSKISISGNTAYKGRAIKDILVEQMKDGNLFFQRDTDALYGDTAKGKKKLLRVQVKKGTTTATLRMPGGTEWTWAWGDKREYNEKDNIPGLEAGDINKAYRALVAQQKVMVGDLEIVDAWFGTDDKNNKVSTVNDPALKAKDVKKILADQASGGSLVFVKDPARLYGDPFPGGKAKVVRVTVKKGTISAVIRMREGDALTWAWGDKREYNEKDKVSGLEEGDINKAYRTAVAQIKTMVGDLELVDAWYGTDDSNSKVSISGNVAYKGRAIKDILVEQMKDGKLFFQRDADALYGDTAPGKQKIVRVQVKKGKVVATLRMPNGTEWTWAWGDKRESDDTTKAAGLAVGTINKEYRDHIAKTKIMVGNIEIVDAWYGVDDKTNSRVSVSNNPNYRNRDIKQILAEFGKNGRLVFPKDSVGVYGDPAPGKPKIIWVQVQKDGISANIRMLDLVDATWSWGDRREYDDKNKMPGLEAGAVNDKYRKAVLKIKIESDGVEVVDAWYGTGDSNVSESTSQDPWYKGRLVADIIAEVMKAGKIGFTINNTNRMFGDPAPGRAKMLRMNLRKDKIDVYLRSPDSLALTWSWGDKQEFDAARRIPGLEIGKINDEYRAWSPDKIIPVTPAKAAPAKDVQPIAPATPVVQDASIDDDDDSEPDDNAVDEAIDPDDVVDLVDLPATADDAYENVDDVLAEE